MALLGLRRAENTHPVEVARDGRQAVDRIDGTSPSEIALVLLDLKLPKISGLDVLAHIHKAYGDNCPPVVVFTNSDEPNDIEQSTSLGAALFVSKPVDYDDYIATMRSIADRWLR